VRKSVIALALTGGALLATTIGPSAAALAVPSAPNVKVYTAVHCDDSADVFLENDTDASLQFVLFYPDESEATVTVKAHHVQRRLVPARYASYLAVSVLNPSYYIPLEPFSNWPTDCATR
jgi:hypothetical protein